MGSTAWSAPLFFTVHSFGMGLTFGAALLESMVLLNSEDAVNAFAKDEVGLLTIAVISTQVQRNTLGITQLDSVYTLSYKNSRAS